MASNSGVGAVLIRQAEHKGAELLSPREMIKLYVEEKNDEADLTEADLLNFVNMAKFDKAASLDYYKNIVSKTFTDFFII